jgi:hypothetical protein
MRRWLGNRPACTPETAPAKISKNTLRISSAHYSRIRIRKKPNKGAVLPSAPCIFRKLYVRFLEDRRNVHGCMCERDSSCAGPWGRRSCSGRPRWHMASIRRRCPLLSAPGGTSCGASVPSRTKVRAGATAETGILSREGASSQVWPDLRGCPDARSAAPIRAAPIRRLPWPAAVQFLRPPSYDRGDVAARVAAISPSRRMSRAR